MPIYEYSCSKCAHTFEEWEKDFLDKELDCPKCGALAKRLISNTSFILKGSGWYVTDYADNGKKNGDQKPEQAESKSSPEQTVEKTNNKAVQGNGDKKSEQTGNNGAASGEKSSGATKPNSASQSQTQ